MVTLQPFNIDGFRGRGLALIYCRGAEARRDQGRSRDSKGISELADFLKGKISCIRGSSEIPFLSLGRSQTRRDHGASGAAAEEGRGL